MKFRLVKRIGIMGESYEVHFFSIMDNEWRLAGMAKTFEGAEQALNMIITDYQSKPFEIVKEIEVKYKYEVL